MRSKYSRKLISLASLCTTLPLFASELPQVGLQGRLDLISGNNKITAAGTSTEVKTDAFNLDSAKLKVLGNLSEDLSYRVRYDLYTHSLERIYVTHKFGDLFSLSLGKMKTKMGAWENHHETWDQYAYSATTKAMSSFKYLGGMAAKFNIANQKLVLALYNSPELGKVNGEHKFGDFAKSLGWYGNFIDGMVKPIVTYSMFPNVKETITSGEKEESNTATQLGVGVQVNIANASVEVESTNFTIPKSSKAHVVVNGTSSLGEQAEQKWQSMVLQAKYTFNAFRPLVKYAQDTHKAGDVETKHTTIAAGLEYLVADNFRYHAIYTSQEEKPKTGDNKTTTTKFILGAAFNI